MGILVTLKGPNTGRRYPLEGGVVLGRHASATICLESQAVSRQHARIACENGDFFVEDLQSSNGTFLNGKRISKRMPLTESDTLQIGPYSFGLRHMPTPSASENELVIRAQVQVSPSDQLLLGRDPAYKLQMILELAQELNRTLDLDQLFEKLLERLMRLFPQADRSMVLLCEGDKLVVQAQKSRKADDVPAYPYSRTIVTRALQEGISILSEDARADQRFQASDTLVALELRSLMCVPLLGHDGRRLGLLQLDRFRQGKTFQHEDLQLLTAVGLHTALVIENVALYAERLREERLHQEVALAREIQQSFLPADFPAPEQGYRLYARVWPACEVAGDLYDFHTLSDGRLSFFVGDVSGKGMPAALFMIAVRILGRNFAAAGASPAETLRKLNAALAADNPTAMFVTMIHGIYQPATGAVVLASAGHPPPLLRRAAGAVEPVPLVSGRLLGYEGDDLGLSDAALKLQPGETLIMYTDGFTEARSTDGAAMFGVEGLKKTLAGPRTQLALEVCADEAKAAVEQFTGSADLQDDLTLFLLQRK